MFGSRLQIAFSPNGQHLAFTQKNGDISIWDWREAKEIRKVAAAPGGEAPFANTRIFYAPDGELLATERMYLGGPKGELAVLRLFDPTTGKNKCTIRLEDKLARMFAFTFSADRRTLALATVQGVK